MARKENRDGVLRNEDVEKELRIRGGADKAGRSYAGSQDTGDDTVRAQGTDVQRKDGLPEEEQQEPAPQGNSDPE